MERTKMQIHICYRIPLITQHDGRQDWTMQLSTDDNGDIKVGMFWQDKTWPNNHALIDKDSFLEMVKVLTQ